MCNSACKIVSNQYVTLFISNFALKPYCYNSIVVLSQESYRLMLTQKIVHIHTLYTHFDTYNAFKNSFSGLANIFPSYKLVGEPAHATSSFLGIRVVLLHTERISERIFEGT